MVAPARTASQTSTGVLESSFSGHNRFLRLACDFGTMSPATRNSTQTMPRYVGCRRLKTRKLLRTLPRRLLSWRDCTTTGTASTKERRQQETEIGVRLVICDPLSLATVVLSNDLG